MSDALENLYTEVNSARDDSERLRLLKKYQRAMQIHYEHMYPNKKIFVQLEEETFAMTCDVNMNRLVVILDRKGNVRWQQWG